MNLHFRLRPSLLALALAFALPAQASPAFDVNDVDILFPLTHQTNAPFYPDLGPLTKAKDAQPLLDQTLFTEIVSKFMATTDGELNASFVSPNFEGTSIRYFHVVNFRYDPCAPESTNKPLGCVQQIRLVVQPFRPTVAKGANPPSGFLAMTDVPDYSLHLTYEVGQGLPTADDSIIKSLLALKALATSTGGSTTGRALTVNRALSAELKANAGPSGRFAKALTQVIQRTVSISNLKEVTVINGESSDGELGTWNYVDGLVVDGHWMPQPLPRLPNGTLREVSDFNGGISIMHGTLSLTSPVTISQDQMDALAKAPDSDKTATDLADLEQLQNPKLSNVHNTDCTSCHLAPMGEVLLLNQLGSWPTTTAAPKSLANYSGLTPFADPKYLPKLDDTTPFGDVHVIGYFEKSPIVTPIAAQFAALSAEVLNHILKLTPPVRDCSAPAVKTCFLNPKSSEGDCLKLCAKP